MPTAPFQYPVRTRRIVSITWQVLLLLSLIEYALAWARVSYGWLWPVMQWPASPPFPLLEPPKDILQTWLTAHLGLWVALLTARAIAFLTPRITLQNNGLLMQSALGQLVVPYRALRGLRSVELQSNGRFVVWVDSAVGLPLQNLMGSLLFGRRLGRGFLLSSDLAGFDQVVERIVATLKQRFGDEQFSERYHEERPTELLAMLNAPREASRKVRSPERISINLRQAAEQMVFVACSLSLPLAVAGLIHAQIPWGALLMPVLAFLEWPLVSVYLLALSEAYLRGITFGEALRAYPFTQLPRWPIAVGFTLLEIAGMPLPIFIVAIVPAIAAGSFLVMKLVEEWFNLRFPSVLIGILVTLMYQLVLYGLFLALLPR